MNTSFAKLVSLSFAVVLSTSVLSAAPGEFTIDPAHSSIEFSVRHLGVSNVKGKFTRFRGTIYYNDADVSQSSATVTIEAASIDTAEPKRDEHLRSADFFEVEKYPDIRFRTTSVVKTGENYKVTGFLVMHGASKEIEIEASLNGIVRDPWGNERLGFEGQTVINRQDFGINYSKVLDNGALIVGNEVKVELNIEAVRKSEKGEGAPPKEAKAEDAATSSPLPQAQKKDE